MENNKLKNFMLLLLKDVEEEIIIYFQELKESIFLASNYSKEENQDNFYRIYLRYYDYFEQKKKLEKEVDSLIEKLNMNKNNIDESFVWEFNKERDKIVRSLDELLVPFRHLSMMLSESIDSLPGRMSNVLRHTRKIDLPEQNLLKNVYVNYLDRIKDFFLEIENNNLDKLDEFYEKCKERSLFFVDYSTSTNFEFSYQKIFNDVGIYEKDEHFYLDSLKLPYWILRIPKFLNFIAHEISHAFYVRLKNENESNFNKKIMKIHQRVERVLGSYSIDIPDLSTFYPTYTEITVQEIIADFISLISSGPSYYFSLFSIILSKKPFQIFSSEIANPYVRIRTLYLILKELFKKRNESNELNIDQNDYWYKMFEASYQYLEYLKESSIKDADNLIKFSQIKTLIYFYEDLSDILKSSIIDAFGKDKLIELFKWEYSKNINNLKNLRDIINLAFSEGNFNEGDKFTIEDIPQKIFWRKSSDINLIKYLEREGPGIVSEIIWSIALNKFNNFDLINSSDFKNLRIPYSRFARTFSLKERLFFFNSGNSNPDERIRLEKLQEWLMIEVEWSKIFKYIKEPLIENITNQIHKQISGCSLENNFIDKIIQSYDRNNLLKKLVSETEFKKFLEEKIANNYIEFLQNTIKDKITKIIEMNFNKTLKEKLGNKYSSFCENLKNLIFERLTNEIKNHKDLLNKILSINNDDDVKEIIKNKITESYIEDIKKSAKEVILKEVQETLKPVLENIFKKIKGSQFIEFLREFFEENANKGEGINVYTSLGECDFLITLDGVSSRKNIDWWPPLWYIELDSNNVKDENNKKPSGFYKFRRYIVHKVSNIGNGDLQNFDFNLIVHIKFKEKGKLKEFIEKIKNIKEIKKNDSIQEINFEVYLSNSWNDITIRVGIKSFDDIKSFLNLDVINENIDERQSFIILKDMELNNHDLKLNVKPITLIQARDVKKVSKFICKDIINYIEKCTNLGVYDYLIKWKEKLKIKEKLLENIGKIIRNDLTRDESLLIDISTLIPFKEIEKKKRK